jgi:RHS repeat-associated protein
MAQRHNSAPVPLLSIIHLKVGHYASVVERNGDQYRIVDRTKAETYWIDAESLTAESSSFFLVPEGPLPEGWRAVVAEDVEDVRGLGPICPDGSAPASPPEDNQSPCEGMASYWFQAVTASLLIRDTPASYTPAKGPAVPLTVSYHHREATQPQIFSSANMGPKWTFEWLRYVQEVPMGAFGTMPAHVWVALPPGGREVYVNPNAQGIYGAHWFSRAHLVRVSSSPLRYERRLPDGSVEVFGQSDGAPAGQRRAFLTELVDPQGQRLQFTWDAQLRLVAITDAIGQVSSIEYDLTSDPLKITAVEDPFGRRATFSYNTAGQLASITDVIGVTSAFTYAGNDFVSTLITPYGTTAFRHEPNAINAPNFRFVEATDPLGGTEHLEWHYDTPSLAASEAAGDVPTGFGGYNAYLDRYNTFHWSKRAWALGPGDLSKATVTHWMVAEEWENWQKYSAVPHSIKKPLEGRVWFAYPGQTAGNEDEIGWWRLPSRIGRVLDGGTSQVHEFSYNTLGHVLTETDPVGRQTSYTYAGNDMDLTEIRQTTSGLNESVAVLGGYTALHQPQTISDAAGQVTTLTYNASGQVLTVTNAKSETTTYGYDSDGYRTTVTSPVAGAVITYGFDGYGRPRTITDSDGYASTTDYDLFDRPIRITFPDATYEELVYNKLDVSTSRDRGGRVTRYYHDALRRLIATRDALGRVVTQEWCGCGSLEAITDGSGRRTRWERDLQGRITREVKADDSDTEYVYETKAGRLAQRVDAKGQQRNYQHFADDALKQVSYANATIATATTSFTYDAAYGRLATMTDGGGVTTYAYRQSATLGAGQLASVDGPLASDTITYSYDELGRPVDRTLAGVTTTRTFDALGRVATLADPIGAFTFAYDGHTRRLQQLTYPNGQTSSYAYFANSGDRRLQDIHHQASGGGTLSRFSYTYDGVGNVGTWTQQYETTTHAYDFSYDLADQLVGAVYRTTSGTPTILKRYGYGYDGGGNRTGTQVDDAPTTWSHNAMNQVTARVAGGGLRFEGTVSEAAAVTVQGRAAVVDGANRFVGTALVAAGTTTVPVVATDASGNTKTENYEVDVTAASGTFTYDANGNLTASGTKTFEWNARDELVRVLDNGIEIAAFAYDGYGRRVQKSAGGVTRAYVYDEDDIAEERVTGGGVSRHVHGPAIDQPLATVDGSGTTYYLADHLGSIVQRTNASGQVLHTRQYDPFGVPLAGGDQAGYAFTGREWDAEIGLYYYRARYYDPELGRFISADPSGMVDGPNLYSYVTGRPTVARDPSGRFVIILAGVAYVLSAAEAAVLYTLTTLLGLSIAEALTNIINSRSEGEKRSKPPDARPVDDYPANPNDWKPPEGWTETSAGEKTGGRHRQWNGPDGEWRRWDAEGRPKGKERGPHWHDSRRPDEHICPTR